MDAEKVFPKDVWMVIMRWCDSIKTILCMARTCKKLSWMFTSEIWEGWIRVNKSLQTGGARLRHVEPRIPFTDIIVYYRTGQTL